LNSTDIKASLFKTRDVANPKVNVKIRGIIDFSFKNILIHALESMGRWNMWDRKLMGFEGKLRFCNFRYVTIHMPFRNLPQFLWDSG